MGPPGIGKTSVAKVLYQRINASQYIDADDLWRIHPFIVDDNNKQMVESNIKHLYQTFVDNPNLSHMIFTWVIPHEPLFNLVNEWFHKTDNTFILLTANKAIYHSRLIKDDRDLSILNDLPAINANYDKMDVKRIDTTELTIKQIVDTIISLISEIRH